ncbi:MAG TPA: hypothetical protein ENK82_06015 [Campylobacterales bacterium]|nr:hypothetical protein [Campylobacterales bacterium]HHS92884.1 hypothetical protein [Campylobacterales bacterium]
MQTTHNSTLKRLTDNFVSLVVLQFINYLLPLILIPYLIRILGMEGFGLYSYLLAIMMYGIHISDYGFELSATYHITRNRHRKRKIDQIVSSVLSIKVLIALLYLLLITVASFFIEKLQSHQNLLFIAYGILLGQLFFPVWFFQGMEKMRYILYLNGFTKLIFVMSLFLLVTQKDELYLLLLLYTISHFILGGLSLYILIKRFNIQLSFQRWQSILFYLKDGWYIFTSKFAVQLYTTVNIIILGFFASPLILGYYAVSTKIIHALGNLLEPLTRAVYPYLVNVQQHSSDTFLKRNQQLALVIFVIMLPFSCLVGYFAEEILTLIIGDKVAPLNVEILQLFSISLIVYLYGSQFTNMLVTLQETKFLNLIVFITAGINLVFAPLFLYFYGVMGMVSLSVGLAFFLTLSKGYFLIRYFKKF